MRIGLKIKSTFRLNNTAMTTQKALFTCLFQPPDTPFLTTPLLKTNWVQDPRHASAVCKNHVPNVLSSQPLHSDPLPQCPVSNLAISRSTRLCKSVLLVLTLVCSNCKVAASYLLSLHTAETNLLRPGTFHPCIHLQILQRSPAIVTLR